MDPIANRPAAAVDSWSRYAGKQPSGRLPAQAQHSDELEEEKKNLRYALFMIIIHTHQPHFNTQLQQCPMPSSTALCVPAGRRPAAADSPGAERPSASAQREAPCRTTMAPVMTGPWSELAWGGQHESGRRH